MIYLEHPVHGRKIALIEAEADFDAKHGWKRYNPHTLETPKKEEISVAPVNALEVKRRGRPAKPD